MRRRRIQRIATLSTRGLGGRNTHVLWASLLALSILLVSGPASASDASVASPEPNSTAPAAVASVQPATALQDLVVEVHRAPQCDCCTGWEAYMLEQGFTVDSWEDPELFQFKVSVGVPSSAMSCHTAIIDGYVVEGHVPVEAILDLLAQRPAIDGIALPGMPVGSPGMPGEKTEPFTILAFVDGTTTVFGEY